MSDELTQLRQQLAQVTGERDTLRSDFDSASRDAFVLKAAHDRGLDPAQLSRLHGTTQEQIEQNAERMRLGQEGGLNGGQQGTAPVDPKGMHGTPDQIIREQLGYGSET